MKTSKDKEAAQVDIKNNYSQCAVSSSGNASVVFYSLASNKSSDPDPSGSNRTEITAVPSKMPAPNNGKRKATEVEESSELQTPLPLDDSDVLDSLFNNPLSAPIPSFSPSEFRSLVKVYTS
ncbi:uncharacterized protein ATC70_012603 [Mucor velutinosus]|uniref:Uncharacterized protein n=1 Tax=Mucor velutinosus TaxID=708070 RepID=A0AAN7HX22_9FUNG|nr:hypothetical protein ATC70_012603 [Mucor velutinosus]